MPKYEVFYITKLSKFVGEFEAKDESWAIEQARRGKLYQDIGGPCHQCSTRLGDAEDGEFVAWEDK